MSKKFTPGPWEIKTDSQFADCIITAKSRLGMVEICNIDSAYFDGEENNDFENEQESNAKLIAAAPDLLEALEGMCSMWEAVCSTNGWEVDHLVEYDKAQAAIKKALGG